GVLARTGGPRGRLGIGVGPKVTNIEVHIAFSLVTGARGRAPPKPSPPGSRAPPLLFACPSYLPLPPRGSRAVGPASRDETRSRMWRLVPPRDCSAPSRGGAS